jgi:hypothetical protein
MKEKTAYEQWLIRTAVNMGGDMELNITNLLYLAIMESNEQAFSLLERTGDTKFTKGTFLKASKLILEV